MMQDPRYSADVLKYAIQILSIFACWLKIYVIWDGGIVMMEDDAFPLR